MRSNEPLQARRPPRRRRGFASRHRETRPASGAATHGAGSRHRPAAVRRYCTGDQAPGWIEPGRASGRRSRPLAAGRGRSRPAARSGSRAAAPPRMRNRDRRPATDPRDGGRAARTQRRVGDCAPDAVLARQRVLPAAPAGRASPRHRAGRRRSTALSSTSRRRAAASPAGRAMARSSLVSDTVPSPARKARCSVGRRAVEQPQLDVAAEHVAGIGAMPPPTDAAIEPTPPIAATPSTRQARKIRNPARPPRSSRQARRRASFRGSGQPCASRSRPSSISTPRLQRDASELGSWVISSRVAPCRPARRTAGR